MTQMTPPVMRASLAVGGEDAARRIADLLTESFDNNEVAIAAFEAADGRWEVSAHFASEPDEAFVRGLLDHAAGKDAAAALAFERVEARDWVRASLDGLPPVRAGRFVVHGAHDRERIRSNQIAIEIEAALAFGTGHHGTTRGCLVLLDDVLRRTQPQQVLDLGTGTGVLAIAAAKVLRKTVLATDIDPRAVMVTRDNAALNGTANLVVAAIARGFEAPAFKARAPFDLVLANILANPLRRLAAPMATHLAPQAHVILSGILPEQLRSVVATYRGQGLELVRRIELEGWSSVLLRRR